MKVFKEYIKNILKPLLMCVGISIISLVVMYLYNQPMEPVVYSFILCITFILLIFACDYVKFYKKYSVLINLENLVVFSIDNLPKTDTVIEEHYNEIVKNLCDENTRIINEFEAKRKDILDYYNIWVHQIKTPIAAMRLLLQTQEAISKDKNLNEENKELEAELFKIEQYVDMVLSYLRQENMTNDIIVKYYSLDEINKQAIRKFRKEFIRRKISLDYEDVNIDVLTDEKWLLFVIEQIISNALKYTKEGKISIYIKEGTIKTLVIEDTGIGIASEDLPRVFEKGYTGYNGRMDKKSTGIGLYLCKSIIDKLGHGISIESEKGVGTKVYINLQEKEISILQE